MSVTNAFGRISAHAVIFIFVPAQDDPNLSAACNTGSTQQQPSGEQQSAAESTEAGDATGNGGASVTRNKRPPGRP